MTNSDGCQTASQPPQGDTDYVLSEVANSALARVAELAPTLKEAELRVLIELTRRVDGQQHKSTRASSRDIANACKLARSKTVAALDSLAQRGLITTRQGTATQPSAHLLNFLSTVRMGGPQGGPPPKNQWSLLGTTLDPLRDHPGPEGGPPPDANTGLSPAAAAVDSSSALHPILDRVLKSKPKDHDPDHIAAFRAWLHGYMRKLGRDHLNKPTPTAHPPDDAIVAQFLAIAEPRRLATMLDAMLCDRATCYSYGWFITTGLQRVHGITWQQTKKARAELQVVKHGKATAQAPKERPDQFQLDLLKQATAGAKKLR